MSAYTSPHAEHTPLASSLCSFGVSTWATKVSPQREHSRPSVKPVCKHVDSTAGRITSTWTTVPSVSPQTEQVLGVVQFPATHLWLWSLIPFEVT